MKTVRIGLRAIAIICGLFFAVMPVIAAIARARLHSDGDPAEDNEFRLVNIFNGGEFRSEAASLRSASILNWYGGCKLDFQQARLDPAGADLRVTNLFGGIDLRIPREWRLEADSRSVFGGTDSETTGGLPGDAPLLRLRARSIFGGVSITNRGAGQPAAHDVRPKLDGRSTPSQAAP